MTRLDTGERVVSFLLRERYLTAEDVVGGELTLTHLPARNLLWLAELPARHLVLKQGADRQGHALVQGEAAVYEEIDRAAPGVGAPLVAYHSPEGVLILEDAGTALRGVRAREGVLDERLGASLGSVLARLHGSKLGSLATSEAPWVYSLSAPHSNVLDELSPAQIVLLRFLRAEPDACASLDRCLTSWAATASTHGDLKADNVTVLRGDEAGVRLIDWETAGVGDPVWDVGSVLADALADWGLRRLQEPARPAASIHAFTRGFWSRYQEELASPIRVTASARNAGARLLQSALERAQLLVRLDTPSVQLFQLGLNVLTRPEEAARVLCGLDPHD